MDVKHMLVNTPQAWGKGLDPHTHEYHLAGHRLWSWFLVTVHPASGAEWHSQGQALVRAPDASPGLWSSLPANNFCTQPELEAWRNWGLPVQLALHKVCFRITYYYFNVNGCLNGCKPKHLSVCVIYNVGTATSHKNAKMTSVTTRTTIKTSLMLCKRPQCQVLCYPSQHVPMPGLPQLPSELHLHVPLCRAVLTGAPGSATWTLTSPCGLPPSDKQPKGCSQVGRLMVLLQHHVFICISFYQIN